MSEVIREGGKTFGGRLLKVRGAKLNIGDPAPDFALLANDLSIKTLADYAGKVKLISVIPTLGTGVCSNQTRRFNQEASNLSEDIVVLTVSADLPWIQKNWCGSEGIDRVETLSTYLDMKFSDDYGVHDLTWRLNQRSVFVLDQDNKIAYTEYMDIVGNEVNFEAALDVARSLVK
jgi:thiol peroxidase